MLVTHKCDNRICCNPAHLKLGTATDNNREISERKRRTFIGGELSYNCVLSNDSVAEIWKLRKTGLGQRSISRALGFNENTVKGVIHGKTWSHLMPEWAKKKTA